MTFLKKEELKHLEGLGKASSASTSGLRETQERIKGWRAISISCPECLGPEVFGVFQILKFYPLNIPNLKFKNPELVSHSAQKASCLGALLIFTFRRALLTLGPELQDYGHSACASF